MRNPLDWALRLFPLPDGTPVRLHAAFFVFALGLTLRQLQPPGGDRAVEIVLFTGPLFFLAILVHELGRYLAARRCGGDLEELLLWPAGGLRSAEFPHDPRGQVLGSLGGLAASGASVLAGSAVLIGFGFVPNLRPLADPYLTEVRNHRDHRTYTSEFGFKVYKSGSSMPEELTPEQAKLTSPAEIAEHATRIQGTNRAVLPRALVWLHRFVWLSWVLFLVNLLPAWPLDMGGVLQGAVASRSDDQSAVAVTAYAGFVVAGLATIVALGFNEVAPVLLATVVALIAYWRLVRPDEFDSGMGGMGGMGNTNFGVGGSGGDYGGYGYSAPEEPAAPRERAKRQPMMKRFLLARAARRMHKENERRQADLDRMDALLEKIAKTGQQSLTDEERRFLERVSTRFHNR